MLRYVWAYTGSVSPVTEVLERLAARQPAQPIRVGPDEVADPRGVCLRVLAQRPAERLADEELLAEHGVVQVGHERVRQQVGVGLLAVPELAEHRGAPDPEVLVDRPVAHQRRQARPVGRAAPGPTRCDAISSTKSHQAPVRTRCSSSGSRSTSTQGW